MSIPLFLLDLRMTSNTKRINEIEAMQFFHFHKKNLLEAAINELTCVSSGSTTQKEENLILYSQVVNNLLAMWGTKAITFQSDRKSMTFK